MNDERAFQVLKAEYLCKYHNQNIVQYNGKDMRLVTAFPSKDFKETRFLLEGLEKGAIRVEYSEKECEVTLKDFSLLEIEECTELAKIFFNSELINTHTKKTAGSFYITDLTHPEFTLLLRDASIFVINNNNNDDRTLDELDDKLYIANQFLISKGFAVTFKEKPAEEVCDAFNISISTKNK